MYLPQVEKCWRTMDNETLLWQNLYIQTHPNTTQKLADLMTQLLKERNLPILSLETILEAKQKSNAGLLHKG